jgi:hypothetical protein
MLKNGSKQRSPLPLANLIIGGVNRSATTSLFTYLSEHPLICPSTIKETNYFLPALNCDALAPIETYAAYFRHSENRNYLMEASPRYIFGGTRIAGTIYKCLGPIRVIFVLRDPVTRMVSYFHNRKRSGELPATMEVDDYASRALAELPSVLAANNGRPVEVYRESIFLRGLAQGFYGDYLREWYDVFPETIYVTFFEHIRQNSRVAVEEVCRWLGLDTSIFGDIEFTQENRSIAHKNHALFKVANVVNERFEPFWRKHKRVKRWIRDLYFQFNGEHFTDRPLSPAIRAELELAYASYNRELWSMLFEKGYQNFPAWLARSPEGKFARSIRS